MTANKTTNGTPKKGTIPNNAPDGAFNAHRNDPQPQTQAQSQSQPKPQAQAQPKPQPNPQPQSKPQSAPKAIPNFPKDVNAVTAALAGVEAAQSPSPDSGGKSGNQIEQEILQHFKPGNVGRGDGNDAGGSGSVLADSDTASDGNADASSVAMRDETDSFVPDSGPVTHANIRVGMMQDTDSDNQSSSSLFGGLNNAGNAALSLRDAVVTAQREAGTQGPADYVRNETAMQDYDTWLYNYDHPTGDGGHAGGEGWGPLVVSHDNASDFNTGRILDSTNVQTIGHVVRDVFNSDPELAQQFYVPQAPLYPDTANNEPGAAAYGAYVGDLFGNPEYNDWVENEQQRNADAARQRQQQGGDWSGYELDEAILNNFVEAEPGSVFDSVQNGNLTALDSFLLAQQANARARQPAQNGSDNSYGAFEYGGPVTVADLEPIYQGYNLGLDPVARSLTAAPNSIALNWTLPSIGGNGQPSAFDAFGTHIEWGALGLNRDPIPVEGQFNRPSANDFKNNDIGTTLFDYHNYDNPWNTRPLVETAPALAEALYGPQFRQANYQIQSDPAGRYQQISLQGRFVGNLIDDQTYMAALLHGGQGGLERLLAQPFNVVLTWGTGAYDLDLHMTGPTGAGQTDRFHIYYSARGSLNAFPFAQLIKDCICSNGSEVILTSSLLSGGVYRISAFNFGNQSATSTNLSNASNAHIYIVRGGQAIANGNGTTIVGGRVIYDTTPPANEAGNTWTAIEINAKTGRIFSPNAVQQSDGSANVH